MIRIFPLLSLILEHKQHGCSTDRVKSWRTTKCDPVLVGENCENQWDLWKSKSWYVDCCMNQTEVHEWKETLKGRQTTTDDTWLERSSTITCAEVKEQIDQYIQVNRKIDMYNTVSEMNNNHGRRCCRSELGDQTKHPNVTIQHTYGAMDQLQLRTDTKCVSSPWTDTRTMVLYTFLQRLPSTSNQNAWQSLPSTRRHLPAT
jgi:hypothetical protein